VEIQGVDDQYAGLALGERHHGKIQAPDLVDAVGDLEQAVDRRQLGTAARGLG
jgi:hypothetical protein